jgi:hypothetical protein
MAKKDRSVKFRTLYLHFFSFSVFFLSYFHPKYTKPTPHVCGIYVPSLKARDGVVIIVVLSVVELLSGVVECCLRVVAG